MTDTYAVGSKAEVVRTAAAGWIPRGNVRGTLIQDVTGIHLALNSVTKVLKLSKNSKNQWKNFDLNDWICNNRKTIFGLHANLFIYIFIFKENHYYH